MQDDKPLIGLIGGMSWVSTALYYQHLNVTICDRLGGNHGAHCVIYSVDFEDLVTAGSFGRWDEVAAILSDAGKRLKSAGATFFLLTANSAHVVADIVEESVGLPLLHIVDATGAALERDGVRRVGILGTRHVTGDSFYAQRLKDRFGIEVISPGKSDCEALHRIIVDELTVGVVSDSSRERVLEICAGMQAHPVDAIVIGCTELPILLRSANVTGLSYYDTTYIHVLAALERAGIVPTDFK